jgi:hypothetical protein
VNYRLASRIITVLLIGVLFGLYVHGDNKKWSQLGRQAYMDHELADFESIKAEPQPAVFMIIGSIIVTAAFFGVYELIVFVLSAIFRKLLPPPNHQPPPAPAPSHYPFG